MCRFSTSLRSVVVQLTIPPPGHRSWRFRTPSELIVADTVTCSERLERREPIRITIPYQLRYANTPIAKFAMRELARIPLCDSFLEVAMIRSMMLVCALGAVSAVGCVASSDAADENAVAQATGGGGALFDCKNVASISVVQCVGTLANVNLLNINVKHVSVL